MKIRKGMRKNEGAWVTILEHLVVLILIGFVQPENKDKYIWEVYMLRYINQDIS